MDDIIFIDLMQSSAFVSVRVTSLCAKSNMYNIAARIVQSHFFHREYYLSTAIALRAARNFHDGPSNNDEEKARAHVNRGGNWLPDPYVGGMEAKVDKKRSH